MSTQNVKFEPYVKARRHRLTRKRLVVLLPYSTVTGRIFTHLRPAGISTLPLYDSITEPLVDGSFIPVVADVHMPDGLTLSEPVPSEYSTYKYFNTGTNQIISGETMFYISADF